MKNVHIWSDEEKTYLEQITAGRHYKEIQKLMIEKFEYAFSLSQIKGAIGRYKLNTGFNGQFKKGSIPTNKGTKGFTGPNKSSFKKGNIPANHRKVGSERINVDGYIEVKIEEPNKWRLKHQLIWEQHNGSIPDGYAVIYGDGDRQNLSIDNLILVTRKQLLILNNNKLIKGHADLTRTGVIIADLISKVNESKRKL